MEIQPHHDMTAITANCAVITVSDTRNIQTDHSGQLIQQLLLTANHVVADYVIIPDDPAIIQSHLNYLSNKIEINVVICNGGTGLAPRDTTYDATKSVS